MTNDEARMTNQIRMTNDRMTKPLCSGENGPLVDYREIGCAGSRNVCDLSNTTLRPFRHSIIWFDSSFEFLQKRQSGVVESRMAVQMRL